MHKLIITLILSLLIATATAQHRREKAKLYFKDGTELVGFAKIKSKKLNFYKEKRKGKVVKYNFEDLKYFEIKYDGKYVSFYYKKIKGKDRSMLMELITTGKVILYRRAVSQKGDIHTFNGGIGTPMGMPDKKISYYMAKNETDDVIKFKQKFKKEAKAFFKDCKQLVELIGTKNYRRKDILDIVDYYNNDCE